MENSVEFGNIDEESHQDDSLEEIKPEDANKIFVGLADSKKKWI